MSVETKSNYLERKANIQYAKNIIIKFQFPFSDDKKISAVLLEEKCIKVEAEPTHINTH